MVRTGLRNSTKFRARQIFHMNYSIIEDHTKYEKFNVTLLQDLLTSKKKAKPVLTGYFGHNFTNKICQYIHFTRKFPIFFLYTS